jgi:molybdopterin-containing oxidoreductase family iron-sulfur binding subunit
MSCPHKHLPIVTLGEPTRQAPQFWRSLEELAGDPAFEARLHEEFPRYASVWEGGSTDRRRFLQLMAASMALAGIEGCSSPPPEPIMPYVRQPMEITPGVPLRFATAMPRSDGAMGLVVTSHMGRPTKVEGNPLHPASRGATDAQAQASVLTLYDPDRSQTVMHRGVIATWGEVLTAVREALAAARDGTGIHVLSAPVSSPTLARQRSALLAAYPQVRWHQYEPVSRDAARQGAISAFGEDVQPIYRFDQADVVMAVDADFLCCGGGAVAYARDFMSRRGAESQGDPNRLYSIESMYTPTGAAADHRWPLGPHAIEAFARALAAKLGLGGSVEVEAQGIDEKWLEAVSADLQAHRGRSIVLAGEQQPAAVHALVHAMNDRLGNVGATVNYIRPIAGEAVDSAGSLRELADALNAGFVNLLLVLECNPVYDAPPELAFDKAIRKAREAIHFGLYDDETAELCPWHVPATHYLESWSDARAYDGTATIVQPLIAPLYEGKTVHEMLSALVDQTPQTSYDVVRASWQQEFGEEFESRWQAALRDGFIADSQAANATPTLRADALNFTASTTDNKAGQDSVELVLLPDPTIGDGRFANNGWLQELPKPLTKLTWENAVLLAPATAETFGLATEDIVRLELNGHSITGPVLVQPGHAENCATCYLGYGRTRSGKTGSGLGFNAYVLRTHEGGYIASQAKLTKTGERGSLARTQTHHEIDGRNIVHQATFAQYQADPKSVLPHVEHEPLPSLLPEYEYSGFAWGMAIDPSKCMGCNSCVVACQAENNVPIVGKERVLRSREMHWLRLDTYYAGGAENPEAIHQPMLCQHCEKAPCEVVCPVAATTHSDEGLNEMVYNRCIGTRYCSNNCPYKVRRFNFFEYQDYDTPVLKLLKNPDVTVRSRGVMEKCTYCVQRINHARIDAKKAAVESDEPLKIVDGSLQTACQQACPTQAIVFGDVNDPNSRVAKLKADPRNYGVLSELNTQPRTTYLVRLRNPNPALAVSKA